MADSALAAFVFAQRPGAAVPPLAVQASEIAATRWAHESCLRPAEVQYNVHRPYSLLPDRVASLLPPALLRSVGLDRVSFPAIELCAVALPSDSGIAPPVGTWRAHTSHITHRSPRDASSALRAGGRALASGSRHRPSRCGESPWASHPTCSAWRAAARWTSRPSTCTMQRSERLTSCSCWGRSAARASDGAVCRGACS